jgi:hypothetical protein
MTQEKIRDFEKWFIEQKAKGRPAPGQESFIEAILNALSEEPSSLTYLNHGNEISEPLVDAVTIFIKRQIEIFGRPPDPAQSISQRINDYTSLAASKSGRIDAWIKSMKSEGRLASVQEPRLKAILNSLPEDQRLPVSLRGFVESIPSLFTTLSVDDPNGTDREVGEESDADIDLRIKLFQESKTDLADLMESTIIKDFRERIRQTEKEKDLERVWVLDRCLGSFKSILDLKSAQDQRKLFGRFASFVDLDILFNKRHPDEIRLKAAQRILLEQIKRPIHPGRWHLVKKELDRLAKSRKRSRGSELQELAKASLFEAIEALLDVDLVSDASFDSQISTDYRAVWSRLNDSLTELLAGPGWREKQGPRQKIRREKGKKPVKVEITAQPEEQPTFVDSAAVADTNMSPEKLYLDSETALERERYNNLMLEALSSLTGKKPEHIKQLIAKRDLTDIKTLARELKLERTKLYREIIEPIRNESRNTKD